MENDGYKPLVALTAAVVAIEVLSDESITSCYQRALERPRMRYLAMGALVVTAAHLLDVLPHSIDPFYINERWNHATRSD